MTNNLVKSSTIAVHQIKSEEIPFSPIDYSKFKFGHKKIAQQFGEELAQKFIGQIYEMYSPREFKGTQIVVVSSPYQFIPTATFAMKDYFVRALNHWLAEHNLPVVQETKITRSISYHEDYGALSAEDRMRLIGKDTFHIDKDFVKGKYCLFLDDIRITGSHEKMIQKMVDSYQLECEYSYLYYAELVNADINPNIENYLNYAYVKSLVQLNQVMKSIGGFLLNTRTVKYILNSKKEEFKTFVSYQSYKFLHTLYHQAIGNSYHLDESYQENLKYIKTLLQTKNLIK